MTNRQKAKVYDRNCTRCSLHETANSVCIAGRGQKRNPELMIIGESPGVDEDISGRAWTGAINDVLQDVLAAAGADPDEVFYTNTVKCLPMGDDEEARKVEVTDEWLEACSEYLWREIDRLNPRCIVPMGAKAAYLLLNAKKIGSVRGIKYDVPFELDRLGKTKIPVVATYNPGALLHGREEWRTVMVGDIQYALRIARGEEKTLDEAKDYRVLKKLSSVEKYVDHLLLLHSRGKLQHGAISVDIETSSPEKRKDADTGKPVKMKPGVLMWDPTTVIYSIQITHKDDQSVLIPVLHTQSPFAKNRLRMERLVKQLKRLFESGIPVVGQNFSFDFKVLWVKLGIRVKNWIFDTMLAHHALYAGIEPNDLDYMGAKYCGTGGHKHEMHEALARLPEDERDMGHVDFDVLVRYACGDSDVTLQLFVILTKKLKQEKRLKVYNDLYRNQFYAVVDMEIHGCKIDTKRAEELKPVYLERMEAARQVVMQSPFYDEWRELTKKENPKRKRKVRGKDEYWIDKSQPKYVYNDINLNSPQQKQVLYYEAMGLPDLSGKGKTRSTDAETVENLGEYVYLKWQQLKSKRSPSAKREARRMEAALIVIRDGVLPYTKDNTVLSRYIRKVPNFIWNAESKTRTRHFEPPRALDTVHASFRQGGTVTGRLSVTDPPLHQIPWGSPAKTMFVSSFEGGLLLHADYSQMELRIMACLSQDKGYLAVLMGNDERFAAFKGDIHAYVASRIYNVTADQVTPDMRRNAKSVSFGIIYGMGPASMALENGITVEEAERILADYFKAFPGVAKFIKKQHRFAHQHGFVLAPSGRYQPVPDIHADSKYLRVRGERQSVNYPIQGSASDVCLTTVGSVRDILFDGYNSRIFNFVHDSIEVDVDTPELLRLLPMMKKQMLEEPYKRFDWLNVPLKAEAEIGVNWGWMMEAEYEPEKNELVLKGNADYWPPLKDALKKHFHVSSIKRKTVKEVKSKVTESGIVRGKVVDDYTDIKLKMTIEPKTKRKKQRRSRAAQHV